MTKYKVVCAWCGKDLTGQDENHGADNRISHGICPDCAERILAKLGQPLDRYLESISIPVVVVDRRNQVRIVNKAARRIGNRLPVEAGDDYRPGDVFECVHAGEPGGCGRTIHCSGCVIKKSIQHTAETGEPVSKRPATQSRKTAGAEEKVDILVSTEKLDDAVILTVEETGGTPESPKE